MYIIIITVTVQLCGFGAVHLDRLTSALCRYSHLQSLSILKIPTIFCRNVIFPVIIADVATKLLSFTISATLRMLQVQDGS